MVHWNSLMIFYLAAFAVSFTVCLVLSCLQLGHLRRHGGEVPAVFQGAVDPETLARISRYTREASWFGILESLCDGVLTLVVLLSGFLPWLLDRLPDWEGHFLLTGLLFFGCLALLSGVIGIPFDLYRTFVIERRHGFGTITLRLWLIDQLKGFFISALLTGFLLWALLAILLYAHRIWWLWAWLVFAAFQGLLLWLYPGLIAPLFNRFEPVRDEGLRQAVAALVERSGLRSEGIYQVDAGKRSRHTNAYFTGIGKTKRIVLFDTLIASHTQEEIVAVLAHEIGHWQGRHVLKLLLLLAAGSLLLLWFLAQVMVWPILYQTFGFDQIIPFVGLLLALAVLGPFSTLVSPVLPALQRRFERQADDAVLALTGLTAPFGEALKRLARDNLANLHPHPLYARFYYSHPPLAERIERLSGNGGG